MLDRGRLRQELRKLNSSGSDRRLVLVVTGENRSGKSHSAKLISHVKKETDAFRFVWCDLVELSDEAEDGEITPLLLGNEIVLQMGYDPIERGEEQESRWTKRFSTELKRLLIANDFQGCCWIVIDHFEKALVNQGAYDLIRRLARRIQVDLDNLRLVLLGYGNYAQLESELDSLGRDPIPTLKKEDLQKDLMDFFLDVYEDRKRREHKDYTAQDIAQAIDQTWQAVDLEEPRWLGHLSRALTRTADSICD